MVDGKMVINEKQAENVRKVFQLCIEGESFWNIGLTMKALDTEKEKLWQAMLDFEAAYPDIAARYYDLKFEDIEKTYK
jgi:hypothetical protein